MFNITGGNLEDITRLSSAVSRSVSAENFKGEKGKGGMADTGTGMNAARDLGRGWKVSPSVVVHSGEIFELASIAEQGVITHIWIVDSSDYNRGLIFRAYWDDCEIPSVEAPLNDFFACADYTSYAPLSSIPVCCTPRKSFNCYWRMPFRKSCRMTLENITHSDITVYYQIDYLLTAVPEDSAYFHARFNRVNPLEYKAVYPILDKTTGKGQYVGTYLFWGVNNSGWWGEGEIKFYLDGDTDYPTICGTGTEDYICGSYNFDVNGSYTEFCTPYSGLAKVTHTDGTYRSQRRFSMYRWHIPDPIYFAEDIRVTIQALGWRDGGRYLPLRDDISSVAYFYLDRPLEEIKPLPDKDGLEII